MREWLAKHGRDAGFALAAILAAGSLALPAGLPARWAATAVLILCLGLLLREWWPRVTAALDARRPGWREIASRWLPYLAVAAGTLIALGPVALGEIPVSQDHANHYFFTDILVHDMLPSGRLFGWTDRVGLGYPFGDIHYTLCYFITGQLHLLTWGLIDLDTSYAIGICIAWLVSSLAIVALARRLGAGPGGATLVGLANAVDVGSDREGGWTYSMFHGVWPQQLATGVWVFAILALWRLSEKADTRRLSLAALLSGVSIWLHPMSSVTLLLAAILLFAVRLLARDPQSPPGESRGAIRLIPALGLGGIIGLLWALRMMVWGDAMWSGHVYWQQLPELAARALTSSLFDHQLAITAVLALVGVVFALRSRRKFGVLAVLLAAILLAVGAMDLVLSWDLGLVGGPFKTLQYRRFSIAIKPIWFALAACGWTIVARGITTAIGNRLGSVTSGLGTRVLVAVILAPCVWACVTAIPLVVESPASRPLTLAAAGEKANMTAIGRLLDEEKQRLGWRLPKAVYWEKPGHGGRYPMFAITDAGFGMLPTVFPPAQNFDQIARTTDPALMQQLGVSLVISRWPVSHDGLEEIDRQGVHRVYRYTELPPAPAQVIGPGRIKVISWVDEKKVLQISGSNEKTRVLLHFTPFDKWKAVQNGHPVAITSKRIGGVFLAELRNVSDGKIELVYEDSLIEDVAFVVGIAALLLCIFGAIAPPRALPCPWPRERLAVAYRALTWCLALLFAVTILAATIAGQIAVGHEWLDGEQSGASVGAVLHRQGVSRFELRPQRFCVEPYTRDPKWGCNEARLAPRLAPAAIRGGKIPSCLSIGLPPGGSALVTFDLPHETSTLKGVIHYEDRSSTIETQVSFGDEFMDLSMRGKARGSGQLFREPVPPGADRVTLTFVDGRGKGQARVCLEAVAITGTPRN